MRVDIPLWYMTNIVVICIVVHNMYTICKDNFDMKWIEKVERELKTQIDNRLLKEGEEMNTNIATINEVRNISSTKNDPIRTEDVDKDINIF